MASAIRTDFFKAAHSRMTEMNSIRDLFEPAEQPGNSKVSRQQGAASAMQPPDGMWPLASAFTQAHCAGSCPRSA